MYVNASEAVQNSIRLIHGTVGSGEPLGASEANALIDVITKMLKFISNGNNLDVELRTAELLEDYETADESEITV